MNPDGAFAHQPGAQASGPVAPSVSTVTRGATLLRTRVGRILRMGRRPLAAAAPLRDTPRSREPTAGACEAGADSRGAQDGSGPARGALPAGPMTLSGLVPTLERSGGATAATARVSRLVAVVCVAAPGYSAGMRFLFVPFSVLGGALAGALGRWLFSAVWAPWTTRSRRVRASGPPGRRSCWPRPFEAQSSQAYEPRSIAARDWRSKPHRLVAGRAGTRSQVGCGVPPRTSATMP